MKRTSRPERILVFRGGAIGDLVLTTPTLLALLEAFPDAALDLIGQGYLLRQDMPEIVKNAARHWDFRLRTAGSQ